MGNSFRRILVDKKRGTERECCLNCFNRTIEDTNKYYCIEKDFVFENPVDIYFMVCGKHRYDVQEMGDKTKRMLVKYKREIKVIT